MAKKTETKEVLERIWDYTLEDIMGERFGSYSKVILNTLFKNVLSLMQEMD